MVLAMDHHDAAECSRTERTPELVGKEDFVVEEVAHALSQLAKLPSRGRRSSATCFDSATTPAISVEDYMKRLQKYMDCSVECYVIAKAYIYRLMAAHPDFRVSMLNIHTLIFSCLVVAAKFNDDVFRSNAHYSRVGGVSVKALFALETHLLKLLDWNANVPIEEFTTSCEIIHMDDEVRLVELERLKNRLPKVATRINLTVQKVTQEDAGTPKENTTSDASTSKEDRSESDHESGCDFGGSMPTTPEQTKNGKGGMSPSSNCSQASNSPTTSCSTAVPLTRKYSDARSEASSCGKGSLSSLSHWASEAASPQRPEAEAKSGEGVSSLAKNSQTPDHSPAKAPAKEIEMVTRRKQACSKKQNSTSNRRMGATSGSGDLSDVLEARWFSGRAGLFANSCASGIFRHWLGSPLPLASQPSGLRSA
eukprot:TRINITY_DN80395_c0_g1_i1.p1 TRINITY_DN80395_c0_g1~~TRINITY_DN80395_c0_g1_i1.p1  ORF type:complete len:423 (+),score=74.26 TRINITY_DN80395_c0_g1_i1:192-1460(+)